jgi:Tol biopolymer transport system component
MSQERPTSDGTHRVVLVLSLLLALAVPLTAGDAARAAVLPADTTAIISGTPDLLGSLPTPVSFSASGAEAASGDGSRVAFTSGSNGLLSGDDDEVSNVYVKDMTTGAVELVSRADGADGVPSTASCTDAAISTDGTRVAFVCDGALDPGDTNGRSDVYVRDLVEHRTILVSRATGAGTVANGDSRAPSIDAHGTHVAFESDSDNLDPAVAAAPRATRIYRRTLGGGEQTLLVGRPSGTGPLPAGDGGDENPSISDDGSRVAFDSETALDAADTNGRRDVYVRNVDAASTTLVSRADGDGAVGNGDSEEPEISGDGGLVVFASTATNFDRDHDADPGLDVYRRSLAGKATQLIDVTPGGQKLGGQSTAASIDADGNGVAFVQFDASGGGPFATAYLRSGNALDVVARVNGAGGAPFTAQTVGVDAQGSKVAMTAFDDPVGDADPRSPSVVLRDVAASTTRTVSRPPGTLRTVNSGGASTGGSVSADGRFVAFVSDAAGLGVPATALQAVLVRDTRTGAVTLASRQDGPTGAPLDGLFGALQISGDGRFVAFTFESRDGKATGVYRRDLAAGRTVEIDRANGTDGPPANASSHDDITISGDGNRVAFTTAATNLGDGDTDSQPDVHVRDVAAGRTLLADRATGATGAKANAQTIDAALSGDGRHVAFSTAATNLGDGDTDATNDVHLRDLDAGTTRLVSATPAGAKGDAGSAQASPSRDGARVAFVSGATNFGVTAPGAHLWVRDLRAGSLVLASRADGAAGAPIGDSVTAPHLSADGTVVAFSARPGAAVAPGTPTDLRSRVFARDLTTNRTRLVSRRTGPDGLASDTTTVVPSGISGDGSCVAFSSFGRYLPPPADADTSQVYLRVLHAACRRPGGAVTKPPPADRIPPKLTHVTLSRRTFRVGAKRTATSASVHHGTVLSLRSTEAAKLTVTFERARTGHRRSAHGPCHVVSRRPRHGACTAYAREGALTRSVRAGTTRVSFSGRLGHRALRTGRHRLTVVARDAAGNHSTHVILRFTIVR